MDDCPASELCSSESDDSGAMGFARSSGVAVIFGTGVVASLLISAVGMAL
ncbi:MAG: hypothetical protein ABJ331_16125 [Marinobacter sp.]